ncbi:MAG: hypothetical protein FWE35_01015 [Streptosporangiales bacterium]|nr:hypothetical protein [Streptosporangiales bacterium]
MMTRNGGTGSAVDKARSRWTWPRRDPAPAQAPAAATARSEAIAAAVGEARDEIARTDGKAGVLLTLSTGALAGLYTLSRAVHALPAEIALWAASALAAAALALLLTVVRPRLGRSRRGGPFGDHERLLNGELDGWQESRLELLSCLAVAKHRKVQRAVDLLRLALAGLAAAAVLAVL